MSRTLEIWPVTLVVMGQFFFLSCAKPSEGLGGTTPELSYSLERTATASTTNSLLFEFPEDTEYQFSIFGEGFTADVALETVQALTDKVQLSYTTEGEYSLTLDIYQPDGTPYLSDVLEWTYSTVIPEPPIVSFSEEATPDTSVTMQIASSRAKEDNEIWVQGDLQGRHASGFWDKLPDSGLYILQVTPEDGLKTMTVKLRNIYGSESEPVEASILKKSVGPTDCAAVLAGSGSANRRIYLELYATNDGPLYYQVIGDVNEVMDYRPFTSGSQIPVDLSSGSGLKTIIVNIRDAARNRCDPIEHTFMVSAGYVPVALEIEGKPLWTEDDTVDLNIRFDHFPSEAPVQMKITGDVHGDGVHAWVDYASEATVSLLPGSGLRRVFAQFKKADGTESFLVSAQVYAKPTVTLQEIAAPDYEVIVSKIPGLEAVTITGCNESYVDVPYAASYPCELVGAQVDVHFEFEDGTTLDKSAAP